MDDTKYKTKSTMNIFTHTHTHKNTMVFLAFETQFLDFKRKTFFFKQHKIQIKDDEIWYRYEIGTTHLILATIGTRLIGRVSSVELLPTNENYSWLRIRRLKSRRARSFCRFTKQSCVLLVPLFIGKSRPECVWCGPNDTQTKHTHTSRFMFLFYI